MRVRIKAQSALLLTIAVVSAVSVFAQAPAAAGPPPASTNPHRVELALDYTYLHSNAPPGGCGCFNMNGGSASFAWPVRSGRVAIVGDLTIDGSSEPISSHNFNLTLGTFTVGPRYLAPVHHFPIQPYGQALFGAAHASGSLVKGRTPASTDATASIALNLGGGADLRVNRTFSVRLAEVDYLLTTYNNGVNNHQNNTRISSGLVFHF
jgi:peptidoglycan-associated lipoprotein